MNFSKTSKKYLLYGGVGLLLIGLTFGVANYANRNQSEDKSTGTHKIPANPLSGRSFYIDNSRSVTKTAEEYRAQGEKGNAALLGKIASQPGTVWLTGPSADDPTAAGDITTVTRTSAEALAKSQVPIYQLYALPNRDACASYSKGGFPTSDAYLVWLDTILASLKTTAVFSVEADGIAQTIHGNCLSRQQIDERYALLTATMTRLRQSPRVLASYLDAGHSEWFPSPDVLVEPLRRAGIEQARGIAVNVSFFVATPESTAWSQRLIKLLGGAKGVIIDTSRNGRGVPPKSETGDSRWCNPSGRGLGHVPTTQTGADSIDAYFWGKIIGESDGACRGYPAAGTFLPSLALELARNAER